MQKLKKYMIIVGVIIIILMLSILAIAVINHVKNGKVSDNQLGTSQNTKNEKINPNIKPLEDATYFYTVETCVQKYYNYASMDREKKYYYTTEEGNKKYGSYEYSLAEGIKNEEKQNEIIYDFLSETFIQENNITKDNLSQKIEKNLPPVNFTALQMNTLDGQRIKMYSVFGKIESFYDDNFKQYVTFIVTLDKYNKTFQIEPIPNETYDSINEINLETKAERIEKKEKNTYVLNNTNERELINNYINFYKKACFNDPELIYYYLNEDYRKKRFGDIEEFKKYVEHNEELLKNIVASKYQITQENDKTKIVVVDANENFYIFEQIGIMQFSLKLDTYTIDEDKFLQEYNKAKEETKVQMNIDKWVQMINNRDYQAAYRVLDEAFKKNYFSSLEEFEEYMRDYFPSFYNIEFKDAQTQEGTYTQKVYLKNKKDENDYLDRTFIMQLQEGTDFVMSMNVYRH